MSDSLSVSCVITNRSTRPAIETVQLYVRDLVGSVTRPVQELKGFQQVELEPGESSEVTFTLTTDDLAFYSIRNIWEAETGEFLIQVGPNSQDVSTITVSLTE